MTRLVRTTDILLRAFFQGTIVHTEDCACAVGNLIAGNIGCIVKPCRHGQHVWRGPMGEDIPEWTTIFSGQATSKGRWEIAATGYLPSEILAIEGAFEFRDYQGHHLLTDFNDPDSYIGLCRVFDLLVDVIDHEEVAARPAFLITDHIALVDA